MPADPNPAAVVQKDESQLRQKRMIADHFTRLAESKKSGAKCVYTFVPGNLTELLLSFDLLPVLPEINALQAGMRGKSKDYIATAEKLGHSEDVCTYVKCDLGMMKSGNVGPTGQHLPDPDLLLLSYTGCFTFLKWFEILKQEYDCPVALLHVPYQGDGEITESARDYVVDQLKKTVIPKLEEISGKSYDEARLSELLARSARAEDDLVWVLESAKHRPSPIDAYFGGIDYLGPIFTAFRGTQDAVDYYRMLRAEIQQRLDAGSSVSHTMVTTSLERDTTDGCAVITGGAVSGRSEASVVNVKSPVGLLSLSMCSGPMPWGFTELALKWYWVPGFRPVKVTEWLVT
jgi:benzoyl-CoA reductase subunit B